MAANLISCHGNTLPWLKIVGILVVSHANGPMANTDTKLTIN